jgi:hypothetical protein
MVASNPNNNDFLVPRSRYYGRFTPRNLMFNANLQEFAQRVGMICALETGGKLAPSEAYEQIGHLWQQLKESRYTLEISEEDPSVE